MPSAECSDVWCSGRRCQRRLRTDECTRLTAEQVYTWLLEFDAAGVRPGRAELSIILGGVPMSARVELRPNAVWRRGRLFLRCPCCQARCTRLYLPTCEAWAWPVGPAGA